MEVGSSEPIEAFGTGDPRQGRLPSIWVESGAGYKDRKCRFRDRVWGRRVIHRRCSALNMNRHTYYGV